MHTASAVATTVAMPALVHSTPARVTVMSPSTTMTHSGSSSVTVLLATAFRFVVHSVPSYILVIPFGLTVLLQQSVYHPAGSSEPFQKALQVLKPIVRDVIYPSCRTGFPDVPIGDYKTVSFQSPEQSIDDAPGRIYLEFLLKILVDFAPVSGFVFDQIKNGNMEKPSERGISMAGAMRVFRHTFIAHMITMP